MLNKDLKKAKIISEVEIHGNVTTACRRAEISRRTVYGWRATDKDFDRMIKNAVKRFGN